MRDYYLHTTDGARIATAELPTPLIVEMLREGFNIVDAETSRDPVGDVRKRFELELFIREKGLRT
jgi:hypothetical protein